jgi:hypothetical protein
MPRQTPLDKQWQNLMSLCQTESRYRTEGDHPRLLKLIALDIDELGRQMGFTDRQIRTREFRAERDGDHIIRIATA